MRIGLYVSTRSASGLARIVERFVAAEREGFRTAWLGQVLEFDALTLLAVAARATHAIELGTWVVPTPPRHPACLAQQALTVQAASGGRLVLGVGVSHAAVMGGRLGLDVPQPLRHLREYLDVLLPLLTEQRVSHAGEAYRVTLALSLPGAAAPPVLIGALGPRMLALAGARTGGAAIWLGGPRYLEEFAIPRLRAAASAAGRPPPRIACGLPVAVCRDVPRARAAADALLAQSARLPAYRRVLEREGAESPGAVALVGDETRVALGIEALASLGVTDFAALPFGVDGDPGAERRTRRLLGQLALAPPSGDRARPHRASR